MDEKETEIRVKRLYFVVDPKDLPDLVRRILDGTLPIVVEWSYDQRRIKPTRAEVNVTRTDGHLLRWKEKSSRRRLPVSHRPLFRHRARH